MHVNILVLRNITGFYLFVFIFKHAQKVPLVERHSGDEVRDDLPLAPINPTPLNPPSLPEEGGNEGELYLDDDVVEEQVRIFKFSTCIPSFFFFFPQDLKGRDFKIIVGFSLNVTSRYIYSVVKNVELC